MRLSRLMFLSFIPAVLVVWAAGTSAPPTADQLAGKKLYTGKCARCHPFYDPTQYDDARWRNWMIKMQRKARLDDEQVRLIGSYVETLRHPATVTPTNANPTVTQ
ncbi:MAG: hypothetical protein EPN23_07605 [Verrucomicrobia bacterium]|nr:MAG: hypothetical protein EPN23_07605 [Verrucomicrobiota bacterium]